MEYYNRSFFPKYQEIMQITICGADDFIALHKSFGGKTIYSYLDITETDLERTFLYECSINEDCFKREFSSLDFEIFKKSEFVFKEESSFENYKNFLKYHKIEVILFDANYDDKRKTTEICKTLNCMPSEANLLLKAKTESIAPVIPVQTPAKTNPLPKVSISNETEISDEIKVLSEILLVLNSKSIEEEIPQDALRGYTNYVCDTHKKYTPKIIEYFLNQWHDAQEVNNDIINKFLKDYDDFEELNTENMLFDFDLLPSVQMLPPIQAFLKTRYLDEVEPVLTGCERFFIYKCYERKNYIINRKIEERLQHAREVSNINMEIISDFVDDKSFAKKEINENSCDDSLLYAAQIYLVTVRLQNINEYLNKISSEIRELYNEIRQITQDLSVRNDELNLIKEEYEITFYGEKMLCELKKPSFFTPKRQRKTEHIKDEIETQSVLLNNLRKYCQN